MKTNEIIIKVRDFSEMNEETLDDTMNLLFMKLAKLQDNPTPEALKTAGTYLIEASIILEILNKK